MMWTVSYTGDTDQTCPITLAPLSELCHPVAFRRDPRVPFECEALILWLKLRKVNPLTNERVKWFWTPLEAFGPLDCVGDKAYVVQLIEQGMGGELNSLLCIVPLQKG